MLVMKEMRRYAAPRPGALELLARLREAAIPAALASNSPRILVDRALRDRRHRTAHVRRDPHRGRRRRAQAGARYLPRRVRRARHRAGPHARARGLADRVAAAVAAGCYTVGVPSLDGVGLEQAAFVAESLDAAAIMQALGL